MTTHDERALGPGSPGPSFETAVDARDPRTIRDPVQPPDPREPTVRRQFWWVPGAATVLVILGVIAVTLWQLHFNLLFTETTTTGGDTGAHIALPAYLENLLPPGHTSGWDAC